MSKRRHNLRLVALPESSKRLHIQVIVVSMRNQDDVDRREIVEGDARRIDTPRAHTGKRADALRPDRVGQDVQAGSLQQEACMADETHAQAASDDARWWPIRRKGTWLVARPVLPAFKQVPTCQVQNAPGLGATWVKEASAVEVVA